MEIAISITKEDKRHLYANTNESFEQNKTIIIREIHEQKILKSHILKRKYMPLMKKGETYSFNALKKRVSIVISFFRFENSRSFMIPSGRGPVGKSLFSSGSG